MAVKNRELAQNFTNTWQNRAVIPQNDNDLPITIAKIWRINTNLLLTISGLCFALLLAFSALVSANFAVILASILAIFVTIGWPKLIGLSSPQNSYLGLSIIAFLAIFAAMFKNSTWLALVAGFGIALVFLLEIFYKQSTFGRLERISCSYLGMMVVVSGAFWILISGTDLGAKVGIIFAVVTAVVSIISFFTSRSVFVVSILNGIIFGMCTAYLLDAKIGIGAIVGVVVSVAYRLSFESFNNVYRENPLFPAFAYVALPMSSIGFIASAIVEVLSQ